MTRAGSSSVHASAIARAAAADSGPSGGAGRAILRHPCAPATVAVTTAAAPISSLRRVGFIAGSRPLRARASAELSAAACYNHRVSDEITTTVPAMTLEAWGALDEDEP